MTGGVEICWWGEGDNAAEGGNTVAEKLLVAEGVVKLPVLPLAGVGDLVGDNPP